MASQLRSDSDQLEQTWVTLVHLHRVDSFNTAIKNAVLTHGGYLNAKRKKMDLDATPPTKINK